MKLLLFDIDGTLIRTHGVGRTAMDKAITAVTGRQGTLNAIRFGGMTDPLILEAALGDLANDESQTCLILDAYIDFLREDLESASSFTVLPGVVPLVEELAALPQVALAVGTGNIEAGARLKMARGRLNEHFPVGGFGSDARSRPDVLAAGVARSTVHYGTEFSQVWVIGDTARDVTAGHAIGAQVIAVGTGEPPNESILAAKPEHFVNDLSDAKRIIDIVFG